MQYEKEQRILKDLLHGERDLIQLHSCLRFLENSNSRLYNRLLNSSKPTKTLEVLAEVKLYIDLVKKIPVSEIIYEPAISFPPDFYFKMDGFNVYLEVKTPSKLKDENIQAKELKKIVNLLKDIPLPRYLKIILFDQLCDSDADLIVDSLKTNIINSEENQFLDVSRDDRLLAKLELSDCETALDHLTLQCVNMQLVKYQSL